MAPSSATSLALSHVPRRALTSATRQHLGTKSSLALGRNNATSARKHLNSFQGGSHDGVKLHLKAGASIAPTASNTSTSTSTHSTTTGTRHASTSSLYHNQYTSNSLTSTTHSHNSNTRSLHSATMNSQHALEHHPVASSLLSLSPIIGDGTDIISPNSSLLSPPFATPLPFAGQPTFGAPYTPPPPPTAVKASGFVGEEVATGDMMPSISTLSPLPTPHLLRTFFTSTVSSSPGLLAPSLTVMSMLAHSPSPFLNPDKNPFLRAVLKPTFYAQFCGGETRAEVERTVDGLRRVGFEGVILGFAREVVMSSGAATRAGTDADVGGPGSGILGRGGTTGMGVSKEEYARCIAEEVIPWATGSMETVGMARKGDFVAIKFSGAGTLALNPLKLRMAPPPEIASALETLCTFASSRGVKLIFDAEQHAIQDGIDDWVLDLMARYNRPATDASGADESMLETKTANEPRIYNTYQTYLHSAPKTLSTHLRLAQAHNFSLGVKLVRGAYMGHDPSQIFWTSKDETDRCFNGISSSLLRREWDGPSASTEESAMVKGEGNFPDVGVCLATHNARSVGLASDLYRRLQRQHAYEGGMTPKTELCIAQLQGMADEVSCSLLPCSKTAVEKEIESLDRIKAYKYLTWGTTGECMKYLLRRAQENKDAMSRTKETRDAVGKELQRRVMGACGLGWH